MNQPEIALLMWFADKSTTMDTVLKVAPLVPALVAALFKLSEDLGRQKRKASLIDSIAKLAKNIAELPELPASSDNATQRLREAFQVELEQSYRELKTLQARTPRHAVGFSSITSGLRSAFLLYRPRGAAAWMLHIGFYACLLLFAFMTLGLVADSSDSSNTPGVVITIYTIMGIPPLIFRYFAMKIHHRQCAAEEAKHAAEIKSVG
jgi:hypothetical protein